MKITMARVLLACEAVGPLMRAKGMRAGTQLSLIRLWKRLNEARGEFLEAELKLAREYGTVKENGQIEFCDETNAAKYRLFRGELLQEEAEIETVHIGHDEAFWAAVTPEDMLRLEGLLTAECEEEV